MEEEKKEEIIEETNDENTITPTEELADVVLDIKREYEERILDINKKHSEEMRQRDDLIRQLIREGASTEESKKPNFIEKINNERNFKKW